MGPTVRAGNNKDTHIQKGNGGTHIEKTLGSLMLHEGAFRWVSESELESELESEFRPHLRHCGLDPKVELGEDNM